MTADADTHQTIGRLLEAVDGLKTTVQNQMTMWATQERSASEGRRILHEKFETLQREVTTKLSGLEEKVSWIEPSIKNFNDDRLRDEGGRRLGRRWWYWILTAAGFGGWGIHELLEWWKH